MGIYIPDSVLRRELPADADNYPFVIGTNGTDLSYKLTYSSDDETFGYHNSKDWFSFLKAWRRDIEHPVEVTVEK